MAASDPASGSPSARSGEPEGNQFFGAPGTDEYWSIRVRAGRLSNFIYLCAWANPQKMKFVNFFRPRFWPKVFDFQRRLAERAPRAAHECVRNTSGGQSCAHADSHKQVPLKGPSVFATRIPFQSFQSRQEDTNNKSTNSTIGQISSILLTQTVCL